MSRYFIEISYNGTRYHGWQRQVEDISVQEVLEENLSKLLKVESVTGAGRTDAGVHALNYYAHFDCLRDDLDSDVNIIGTLNRMLPEDISVHNIHKVRDDANARFDAISRTYKYYILREKNPFKMDIAWYNRTPLDLELMNKACLKLLGKQDFTSFSKLHSDTVTNICTISEARWDMEDDMLVFTITADRFLRNMVRAVVGTLYDIGRGYTPIEDLRAIIEAKDRCRAGTSVPPQGLFLVRVTYPDGYFS